MRFKTALLKLFLIFFLSVGAIYAQSYEVGQDTVTINGNITIDFYSTVTVNPSTVEISRPSTVTIRILSPNGQGIAGRQVIIFGDGLNITNPSGVTDSFGRISGSVSSPVAGTYTVCARDITFGYDIEIQNCSTLYVVPVPAPAIFPEPQYTKGLSNIIMWQSLGSGYKYNVIVTEDPTFMSVKEQSGYIDGTSFEFTNLENGKMYFYEVRAQNQYGGIGAWSNHVYSVQDAQPPVVEVLNIGSIGENDTVEWTNSYAVTMIFRVTDNLQISSAQFKCLDALGKLYNCINVSSLEGDIFTVQVKLGDLERISGIYLRDKYEFCVEASDAATNITRQCSIYLEIPQGDMPVEPEKPPVADIIDKVADDITSALDDTIGQLDPGDLNIITTTTTVVTVTTAVAVVAGGIGSIPYFLLQLLLNILSFFGFGKGRKPMGFVYNSVTKEPISQAIIRIFDEKNRIVWSDVTDSKGYFSAKLDSGKYRIVARAPRYKFPSNIVFGKEDYPLTNIYHGEMFAIKGEHDVNFAVPLDPMEESKLRIGWESLWGRIKYVVNVLHIILFLVGITFAFYTYYVTPSLLSLFVLLLFVPTFFFILRNILANRDRYGIVFNKEKNKLEGIVIGLREAEFDRIIAKRVSDRGGRYRFLVDEGRYYLEVLDTTYKVENIQNGNEVYAKKETLIDRDITVSKIKVKKV
jgi:hypothetical protein